MSAGVLDLRSRHLVWRLRPAKTTVQDRDVADRLNLYHAIVRDGMFILESRSEDEPEPTYWTRCGTYTLESLTRLADEIAALAAASAGRTATGEDAG